MKQCQNKKIQILFWAFMTSVSDLSWVLIETPSDKLYSTRGETDFLHRRMNWWIHAPRKTLIAHEIYFLWPFRFFSLFFLIVLNSEFIRYKWLKSFWSEVWNSTSSFILIHENWLFLDPNNSRISGKIGACLLFLPGLHKNEIFCLKVKSWALINKLLI